MNKVINTANLIIQNTKVQNNEYTYTFHQFYEDKQSILVLYLIIPGIRHDSVHIEVDGDSFYMSAYFDREYVRIFRAQQIEVNGKLQDQVKENVFTTEYRNGILKIILVIIQDKTYIA